MQAGAKEVLQAIMDTGVENVTTDRAKFALTWLTVGADQDDFKAPKGEKTFEGKSPQRHAPLPVRSALHDMVVSHTHTLQWLG